MRTRLSLALLLPILHACTVLLPAQNASAPGPAGDDGEIVKLDTFEVVSGDDTGYAATDSITGTRVATLIRDLPYTVNVVMSEFMEDFALLELPEQFAYTSSFSPDSDVEGSYSLRGVPNSAQLRNGFRRGGLVDRINISRVEVIKGPAASIYGQTQPGGMINVVTTKPKSKPGYYLGLSAGSYDSERVEMSATGPLFSGKRARTTYLLSASSYKRNYEQEFRHTDQQMWALVVSHKFSADTSLSVEYEHLEKDMGRGTALPFTIAGGQNDSVGRGRRTGYAYELFSFSLQGPHEYNDRAVTTFNVAFEHRFGRVLSMKASFNYDDRDFWRLRSVGDRFAADTRNIIFREPEYSTIFQYSRGAQIDFLAHWRARDLGWEQRVLLTLDYNFINDARQTWQTPSAVYNDSRYNVRNLNVDNPDYFLLPHNPDLYTDRTRDDINRTGVYGFFLRYQISAMQGRLVGVAGTRFDYVDFDLQDQAGGSGATVYTAKHSANAVTPQAGLNYKITPEHTFFVNYSTSFMPQGQLGDDGEKLDNEEGIGYEAGFKSLLFNKRLSVTASIYSIEKKGVKTTETEDFPELDADGNPVLDPETGDPVLRARSITRTMGTVKSEGIEMDFNYQVGKQFQLLGGWGYTNPRLTYAGNDLDAVGRRPAKTAKMNGGVAGKYSFKSGWLKGLALNLGVRYMGNSYPTAPTTGGIRDSDDYVRSNDGRRDIRVPSYIVWDAGAAYEWRTGKFRHRVRINFKNIFDRQYIDTGAFAGERFGAYAGYTLRF
ncbi:TonB-dependent receptor [Termitidicoccus mucosus]|uniref:TonB-dependent receptor plug domain-containing protein n=1 Tax=Termitidicoccus mucosus TaxID=1184151 RepID=A0A178IHG3_9BACT|nr:hypothetical protein AW736_13210 [Opitutaceae bacterium TSB47]